MASILRSTEQRHHHTPGGNVTTPLAAPSTGAAHLLVVRQRQAPGGANPWHRKSTEALVVVVGGEVALVGADELHRLRTIGAVDASWLVVTPGDVRFTAADGTAAEPVWAS
jgi:quercetin dioxygenase-like cupin family protein